MSVTAVPAVSMRDITVQFGSLIANDGIDLCVQKGEIHAILGENGAGKSTLMNVLYGLVTPVAGAIHIHGQPLEQNSPQKAIAAGIGMVHQHFMLVQPFTITQNIVLGNEPRGRLPGTIDMNKARSQVRAISEQYGLAIEPDARIENISVGMQQRTEILKTLYRGADILILDEPTSSLTPQEISELIIIMRNLAMQGKTLIIITHKLREIKAVADRCTIIRSGKLIDTVDVADITENELAAKMVGRTVDLDITRADNLPGDNVLEVRGLTVLNYRGVNAVDGLDLSVRRGEILGIAGVDGNGQTELVEALTGLRPAKSGSITLNQSDVFNKSPRRLFDAGISSIPEDRQRYGLVGAFTVGENMVLQNIGSPPFSSRGIINRDEIFGHANQLIQQFDIRPVDCSGSPASSLSGGNQQKVIVAREVTNDKDLLICANPTRGLDVGAIEYVRRYIMAQRDKGKAILLISFELDEIISLSDRVGVIFGGKIVYEQTRGHYDEQELGLYMAGGQTASAKGAGVI